MPFSAESRKHYSRFTEKDLDSMSMPTSGLCPHLSDQSHEEGSMPNNPAPVISVNRVGRPVKRLRVKSTYKITPRITLLTMVVVLPTIGLAAAFFYALFNYKDHIADGYLYSTVPANVPLFIGTITSTLMSVFSTVVMILFAYRVAQMWIDADYSNTSVDMPNAEQFAFMMKMCSGGSFFVMLEYLLFVVPFELATSSWSLRRKFGQQKVNPALKRTAIVFSITLFLTVLVQLADVWVHKTLESETLTITSLAATSTHNYSRILRPECSTSMSESSSVGLYGVVDTSCVFGSDGFLFDPLETFATATNTSNTNAILNDGVTAYITPATRSTAVSFKASTIGVSTRCEIITPLCDLSYPSSGYARFTCGGSFSAMSGLMYADQIFQVNVMDPTNTVNPFWINGYGCFKDYASTFPLISATDFLDVASFNSGNYVGLVQSCTILACLVEVSDLNYTSMPSLKQSEASARGVMLAKGQKTLSSIQTTKALTGAISQSYGVDQISLGVTSAAVKANTSEAFATYVALSISESIIAQSAGAFIPALSLSEKIKSTRIGCKVPLIPILTFLASQLILALFCVFIAAVSIGVDRSEGAQAVKTARHALIDVNSLITEHFGDEMVYPPSDSRAKDPSQSNLSAARLSMRSFGRFHTNDSEPAQALLEPANSYNFQRSSVNEKGL